jgi:hypothetical protein
VFLVAFALHVISTAVVKEGVMWAMVKAANEAESERLKNITTRLIANLMCDYKLVHLVVDNLGVKVRLCARTPLLSPPSLPASRLFLCTFRLVGVCRSSRPVRAVVVHPASRSPLLPSPRPPTAPPRSCGVPQLSGSFRGTPSCCPVLCRRV